MENPADPPRARPRPPLSFRRKLALIVGVPSLVALAGGALALARVANTYHRAHVLEQANASSSYLIQAAATQAKERGFTAAALSDAGADAARRAILDLRVRGDNLLSTALSEARGSLGDNAVLTAAYVKLLEARDARDRKRTEVDGALLREQTAPQSLVQDWFDTQTRLIGAEQTFGSTLFLAQNPYELVIQYNGYIKANVFAASEFAGRERARIGRFIALGQPIPPERLEELQRWRGVVEENLDAIARLRANPAMSPPVLARIDRMEKTFLGDYEAVRASVYAASAHRQPYPLSTDEWIAASTRGIDSIIAVSDGIGEEAARISRQQAAFSFANVLLILGGLTVLGVAVVASVLVARRLGRRLAELRGAAERVARGDFDHPVWEDARGGSGDEFDTLARAFNTMQDRVQAGIEQLRTEKSGVEARVAERTRELSGANARLQALNEEKDTFLSICSHDLKNPLSSVVGMANILDADAEHPVQVRAHAADILHAAEFMFGLVTNLLDLGAIEQGKFNLQPAPLDLAASVNKGVENYRRRAADKGIRLTLAAPPTPGPVLIRADARAVAQVVDNLVSNGVKYTPAGGAVEVRLVPGADASTAGFAVRDTGPGLSAADQARLFQKYTRLSSRVTGGESSTGLGLSIVKRLVEAMGGTVRCRSALGEGSTFTAEFPVADASDGLRNGS